MIEKKITVSFDDQDFIFAQQVDEDGIITMETSDDNAMESCFRFSSVEQIDAIVDNLCKQRDILKDAKKSTEPTES